MTGYTKLFQTILTSSIWGEDDQTRIVWITMLALADQNGEVQASIPGLARQASVSVEAVEKALAKFSGPDKYSRTPDFEGRRIKQIEGGWLLLNHAKYRAARDQDRRREQVREAVRRYRSKTDGNQSGNQGNQCKPQKAQAEAEAEAEKKTPCSPPMGDPESTEPSKKDILKENAKRVIQVLNECTGSQFRCSDGNLKLITARLEEDGVDLDGVLKMVRRQSMVWGSDEKMAAYLRPETLFNKTKFESYYANREMPATNGPAVAAKASSDPRTFNDQMALFIRNQQLKANVQS